VQCNNLIFIHIHPVFACIAGRVIFKRFGWGVAALITPITLLTTGIAFFSLTLFPAFFAPITAK
jgi:AAA family ATP:ADP antiporter